MTSANAVQTKTYTNPFQQDVLLGLSQAAKQLPCKYFYDARGARLFTQICDTPEYYITRTELGIMRECVADMAQLIGTDADILEFGSGEGIKIRLLLNALQAPRSYTPMDISEAILHQSAQHLKEEYPTLKVSPVAGDFTHEFPRMPEFQAPSGACKLVYFPGSSLSNFSPDEAIHFLTRIADFLPDNGCLLIGIDRIKSVTTLHRAYNDAQGVTAAFNLNLLSRINRELEGDFDLDNFEHYASYNPDLCRMEMRLVSRCKQLVTIAGCEFSFAQGEAIHTENSYKFSLEGFRAMAEVSGFHHCQHWSDKDENFSVFFLQKTS